MYDEPTHDILILIADFRATADSPEPLLFAYTMYCIRESPPQFENRIMARV